MKQEIEAKFLDVDFMALRSRLTDLGAICEQSMRLMRRAILQPPHMKQQNSYARVRDEGNKVTMTYKKFADELTVDGAQEIEVMVSNFQDTVDILKSMGLTIDSLQESKRETWSLDGVEIALDEWPWLKPYIEIEGESVQAIQNVANKLGLQWGDAAFGDVMVAYRAEYPHLSMTDTVGDLSEVVFDADLPDMFKKK